MQLAPSTLVIERAKASWHEKASSMYSSWALKNAIARAFEVVVMTELLKFELCIQSPGSFRNMTSLPNEKMNVVARLESSDLNALKGISETVFSYMMAGISQNFEERGMESRSWIKPRFPWEKSHSLPTLKSAFQLLPLSETEISAHMDEKVKLFTLKEIASTEPVMASRIWWPIQKSTILFISSKVIASESWIYDHVPVHRLVANLDVITADVQGGHKNGSLWEMQLTHAQLVDLANLLDLYYEDRYTCQHKRLPNEHTVVPPYYSRSKGFLALPFKVLFGFVGAFMLVGLFILSRRGNFAVLSQITKDGSSGFSTSFQKLLVWRNPLTRVKSKVLLSKIPKVSPKELETLCVLVTAMVKDTFQWPQDIESSLERGAWMGKDLTGFERRISKDDTESPATSRMEASQFCLPEELGTQGVHTEAFEDDPKQNILVFKVTVSKYGKLIKIQPVNRSAITCWSNYPLTELLHTDVTTGPGFVKHGLELSLPLEDDAVIELIVQHDESSPAVSARPFHL
ncbi:hypothetical protein O6H91_05G051200 [Diphasiastrum complanatum]|uniref:Uncharacterized protein n=1 Tax=Diphasiastrum complanatum TaxID=34168 RepID=A0ACC2DN47_DIPCM|nr:hypothetical protein O6H91_05G051200 [Diphasiastrum complanatum]